MSDWSILLVQLIILVLSLVFLIKFSDIVSDSSYKIAVKTGLGEMAVGFLILSIITSLPELAVSVSAVNSGDVGIPIGGLFGSNIANVGLILGLTALLAPTTLKFKHSEYRNLSFMIVVTSLVPLLFLILGNYGNLAGVILLTIFIVFAIYSIRRRIPLTEEINKAKIKTGMFRDLIMIFGGVAVIILSSHFVVDSSVKISTLIGVDQSVIGATVIAIGTSLPELSVSLAAVKKMHMSLAIGNILGSCITNLTLILGFVLAFSPLKVNPMLFVELAVMLIIVNLTLWRFILDDEINMGDGFILILLYLIFVMSTLGIQIVILSPEYLTLALTAVITVIFQVTPYLFIGLIALILGWLLNKG